MLRVAVLAAVMFAGMAATPAGAHHDRIYGPCGVEYGFVHMTYDEWAARITSLEADGTIPPGVVFRYDEELHGGKGKDDPRVVWARNLVDGQILSIDDWANGNYPEIEKLMFDSGLIPEWQLDANYEIRRFDDPFWSQRNPVSPTWTVWQTLCMASFPVSKPAYEVVDGLAGLLGAYQRHVHAPRLRQCRLHRALRDLGEGDSMDGQMLGQQALVAQSLV